METARPLLTDEWEKFGHHVVQGSHPILKTEFLTSQYQKVEVVHTQQPIYCPDARQVLGNRVLGNSLRAGKAMAVHPVLLKPLNVCMSSSSLQESQTFN